MNRDSFIPANSQYGASEFSSINAELAQFGYRVKRLLMESKSTARETYLVEEIRSRKVYVLKIARFPKRDSRSEANWSAIKRVTERETNMLQSAASPQIPYFFRKLEPANADWIGIVQEYIDGTLLNDYCHSDWQELADLMLQLLGILKKLQLRKIVHLDIKPTNVMVRDGKSVLIDFGSAKQVDDWDCQVQTTVVVGSYGFAAPDYLVTRKADNWCDLFGLASTIICRALNLDPVEYGNRYAGLRNPKVLLKNRPPEFPQKLWEWLVSILFKESGYPTSAAVAEKQLEKLLRSIEDDNDSIGLGEYAGLIWEELNQTRGANSTDVNFFKKPDSGWARLSLVLGFGIVMLLLFALVLHPFTQYFFGLAGPLNKMQSDLLMLFTFFICAMVWYLYYEWMCS